MIQKLKSYKKRIDREISLCLKEATFLDRLWIYLDYVFERVFYGTAYTNYFQYEYYHRNRRCRNTFIGIRRACQIYKLCNPQELRYLTSDKATFNRRFSDFLGRGWLDVEHSTFEEFCSFVHERKRFFLKPGSGERGEGAGIITVDDSFDAQERYRSFSAQKAVLEDVIEQHPLMASLHPSSVNSIRLVTLRDAHETVRPLLAVLRIGKDGEQVDNFHHNGICAAVDLETGLVTTHGVDHDHNKYIVHPDTGVPIVGFRVPEWSKIIETALKAAPLLPELRYTGWDLAISKDGNIMIIEGNSTPDSNITQLTDLVGKWPLYEPLIRELKAMQRK